MICPKCGRPVNDSAVICGGCDFILDSAFLGTDILDEERALRPGVGGINPAKFNLADAVILGDLEKRGPTPVDADDDEGVRFYIAGRSQALMAPDAVPARLDKRDTAVLKLTPFERHVLQFIDGEAPVETIRRRAGLDHSEVKTALATLADKGVVHVVGRVLEDAAHAPEAAARNPSARKRRASTGISELGAVALIADDDAGAAVDHVFRTRTELAPLDESDRRKLEANDSGDVFATALPAEPALESIDDLPSDADVVSMPGTQTIMSKKKAQAIAQHLASQRAGTHASWPTSTRGDHRRLASLPLGSAADQSKLEADTASLVRAAREAAGLDEPAPAASLLSDTPQRSGPRDEPTHVVSYAGARAQPGTRAEAPVLADISVGSEASVAAGRIHSDHTDMLSDVSASFVPAPAAAPPDSTERATMRERARALFEEAESDYNAGRVGAARMNAKLACIYDPDNPSYRDALARWERGEPGAGTGGDPDLEVTANQAGAQPREVQLYEQAQYREAEGDIDGALALLGEGIRLNPNIAAFHNRFGVLMALYRGAFDEAAAAIRKAVHLEPDNLHYKSNLGKIVARQRAGAAS